MKRLLLLLALTVSLGACSSGHKAPNDEPRVYSCDTATGLDAQACTGHGQSVEVWVSPASSPAAP